MSTEHARFKEGDIVRYGEHRCAVSSPPALFGNIWVYDVTELQSAHEFCGVHQDELHRDSYYAQELAQLPLDPEILLHVRIHADDGSATKHMCLNAECIQALREFLDRLEASR